MLWAATGEMSMTTDALPRIRHGNQKVRNISQKVGATWYIRHVPDDTRRPSDRRSRLRL